MEDGFAPADLRPSTLVSALRDEKKDHLAGLTKRAGLIKELEDNPLKTLPSRLSHEHHLGVLRRLHRKTL